MNTEPEDILDAEPINVKAIAPTLLIPVLAYVSAIIVLFFFFYIGFLNILPINNEFILLIWQDFLLTMSFLIPGYLFQQKLFELLNKSLLKSAIGPIIIWGIISLIILTTDFNLKNVQYILTAFAWFTPLCFLISWHLAQKKTNIFIVLLVLHWVVFSGLQLLL